MTGLRDTETQRNIPASVSLVGFDWSTQRSPLVCGVKFGIWDLGFGFWDFPTQQSADRDQRWPVRAWHGARVRRHAAGRRARAFVPVRVWRVPPVVHCRQVCAAPFSCGGQRRLPAALRLICFPILEPCLTLNRNRGRDSGFAIRDSRFGIRASSPNSSPSVLNPGSRTPNPGRA